MLRESMALPCSAPREDFVKLAAPTPPDAGAPREHGLAMLGAPDDFLPDEKVTKESPRGDTPLGTPLGGRFAPPAVPATPSIGFHPLTQTDLPL